MIVNKLYEILEVEFENIKVIDHIHFSESDGNLSFRFEY